MTSEDDFQKALDDCPEDWQTRSVFADWLQDRGDRRAEGYRALAAKRLQPWGDNANWLGADDNPMWGEDPDYDGQLIPRDWYEIVRQLYPQNSDQFWRWFDTRREAEDAAALAFAKLPKKRRLELLATPALLAADGASRSPRT